MASSKLQDVGLYQRPLRRDCGVEFRVAPWDLHFSSDTARLTSILEAVEQSLQSIVLAMSRNWKHHGRLT